NGVPQQQLTLLRQPIADLGLTMQDVAQAIQIAIAGSGSGEFSSGGERYRILLQLADAEKRTLDELLNLSVQTPDGEAIALRQLVATERNLGAVTIVRKDQQRLIIVTANISDRDSGTVAADLQQQLNTIAHPASYELRLGGSYAAQQQAFAEMMIAMVLALLLVYMVLASQYESFRDPLIVMLTVPLAAIGVLLTLHFTATTFNLQSGIGTIMLVGIVVNNAILLVDQARLLQQRGMSSLAAVSEAGRRRLRPVLMTSLTTILALLPLALGMGEGAETQAPMARVVIGGLASSTLITLIIIPVVYSLVHAKDGGYRHDPQHTE
ncbi:MAG: efflux RND transporter permease subunit, partial [Gammaproteobacteria bacterium]|nr:efflux RND transporter permease subunit [Gammaproteobacteria bacterium]